MKTFTEILNETAITNDVQPGNQYISTGVTNHFTPVENILTNINNLFCTRLGVVAAIGEDNVSIKLHSSKFINSESIDKIINEPIDNYTSLSSYIMQQGLTKITKVNLGTYYVVYFSPTDIKQALDPKFMEPTCADCSLPVPTETCESMLSEFEMSSIITESDEEEELKSQTVEKVIKLLNGPDKVKAAKQLELLVSNEIQLPREFYFAAIKFKSGEEAIALRWKYTKTMPFGKDENSDEFKDITIENTRSIMHIFGQGEKAIWVQDFDKKSIVQLPEEVEKLIESILELLEAEKTDNPAIYSLSYDGSSDKNKEDKEDKEDKDDDEDKLDKSDDDSSKEDKEDKEDKKEDNLL